MCELFPELDKAIVSHILRDGVRLKAEETIFSEALQCLLDLGIITTREHRYVRCAYKDDYDFLDRGVLGCPGRVDLDAVEEDYYCPECGQPIGDVEQKTVFVEYEVSLSLVGIESYLDQVLKSLEIVEEVEKVGLTAFCVQMQGEMPLTVVVPEYSEIRHRFAGLFFAEPTLYIIASPINEPVKTVLDEKQYIQLADLLSMSANEVQEVLMTAAAPISGRRSLIEAEARFDEMIARHGGRAWQFFEQDFIPALILHITESPELAQQYLNTLRKLSGTIFGEYHVPIGGAGVADLRPIDKFELMNQVFAGNATGDAKCYPKSTLSYNDVITVNYHLDSDPSGAKMAIIYVAGDEIASTAWNAMMELKQPAGSWKVIILPKYLLLELINAMEATHLLNM
jgi:hypothetical protein